MDIEVQDILLSVPLFYFGRIDVITKLTGKELKREIRGITINGSH